MATEPTELVAIPALAELYANEHVEQQEGIASRVATGLSLLWPIIRFDDIDASAKPWLHAATLQIKQGWEESSDAAFDYVQAAQWSVEPDAPPLTKVDISFPVQDIQTAMRVRGPIEVKRQIERAKPQSEALNAGKVASSGTGATKATDGGRTQVIEQVRKQAPARMRQGKRIGYARKTDSNPCYFCALLASQGAVFFTEDAFANSNSRIREVKWSSNKDKGTKRAFIGDGPAKVHDNCQCTMRPVFSESDKWDERAKFFLAQWNGSSGEKDFRRNYVPPPPYDTSNVLDESKRRKILSDVQSNRDALIARGFKGSDPAVKFLDRSIQKLSKA